MRRIVETTGGVEARCVFFESFSPAVRVGFLSIGIDLYYNQTLMNLNDKKIKLYGRQHNN